MNHQYSRYFKYDQLPPRLQQVSKPFCELARWMIATLPDNRMSAIALEKLIEVKDAAVRSALDEPLAAVPIPPERPPLPGEHRAETFAAAAAGFPREP